MEQIVSNLLDNAVKYTPPKGRISIAVRREGEQAVLEVADDGQGISPELIGQVFELFVQGERGLAREQGGLGIGLTLVKRLAELHGGSVRAASAGPGRGATFTISFPAIEARPADAHASPARPSGGPRHVLLVDDNQDARESLARLLELSGHRVRSAKDGAEGVRLAAEERPDVALVDVGLPDISGYEVAARLRAQPGGARILLAAITGYGRDQDRDAALKAGFDAHLTKPVEIAELERLFAGLPSRGTAKVLDLRRA
jgi:CheY-like chemotaxis protein